MVKLDLVMLPTSSSQPLTLSEAPVVGMDVKHLKEVFLHDFETSRLKFTARVVSHEWEVICVPAIPMPHRPRVWLAKMQLFSNLSDGRQRSSGWQFYRYLLLVSRELGSIIPM